MQRPSLRIQCLLAAVVAVVCGLLHAMPGMVVPPRERALQAALRGVSGVTSALDAAAAAAWERGGPAALAAGDTLLHFLGWTVGALGILAVVLGVLRTRGTPRLRAVLFGLACLALLATAVPDTVAWMRSPPPAPLVLRLPTELIGQVAQHPNEPTFASPTARAAVQLLRPDLAPALGPPDAATLVSQPDAWRAALREKKWTRAMLAGPISEFRPLLDHLLVSPDWHLAAISNRGYLFLRGTGAQMQAPKIASFHLENDLTTAIYLSQAAEYLEAARRTGDARAAITRALELAPTDPTVLSHAAALAASRRQWQEAITFTSAVLARFPNSRHARVTQALALLETGNPSKAQALCDEVLAITPNDSYTLFLNARICRALHDYRREAELLERLVTIARRTGGPVADYQIFLAQAQTHLNLPDAALKNYREALAGGSFGADQAAEVRDAITAIESKRIR